jgi:hypothetical protein
VFDGHCAVLIITLYSLKRFCIVRLSDQDFEFISVNMLQTGTGQQVAQIHDRYMMMNMLHALSIMFIHFIALIIFTAQ